MRPVPGKDGADTRPWSRSVVWDIFTDTPQALHHKKASVDHMQISHRSSICWMYRTNKSDPSANLRDSRICRHHLEADATVLPQRFDVLNRRWMLDLVNKLSDLICRSHLVFGTFD